mgnify:CR=1 FL=1
MSLQAQHPIGVLPIRSRVVSKLFYKKAVSLCRFFIETQKQIKSGPRNQLSKLETKQHLSQLNSIALRTSKGSFSAVDEDNIEFYFFAANYTYFGKNV